MTKKIKKNAGNNTASAMDPAAVTFDWIRDQIDSARLDYEASLIDGTDLRNTNTFNGMIDYISHHVFYNINKPTDIDINILDHVFHYYVYICSLYGKMPYILQFLLLIHIDDNTFNRWCNGIDKASRDRIGICQSWRRACELAQVSDMSVKSMFLLKAKYGYVEASQPVIVQHEIRQDTTNLIDKYKDYPQLNIDNKQGK